MDSIYVISAGPLRQKIGISQNPESRLRGLQTAHHLQLELRGSFPVADAPKVERMAHHNLSLMATRLKGEWFEATFEQAMEAVHYAVGLYPADLIRRGEIVKCIMDPSPDREDAKPLVGNWYTVEWNTMGGWLELAFLQTPYWFHQSYFRRASQLPIHEDGEVI